MSILLYDFSHYCDGTTLELGTNFYTLVKVLIHLLLLSLLHLIAPFLLFGVVSLLSVGLLLVFLRGLGGRLSYVMVFVRISSMP